MSGHAGLVCRRENRGAGETEERGKKREEEKIENRQKRKKSGTGAIQSGASAVAPGYRQRGRENSAERGAAGAAAACGCLAMSIQTEAQRDGRGGAGGRCSSDMEPHDLPLDTATFRGTCRPQGVRCSPGCPKSALQEHAAAGTGSLHPPPPGLIQRLSCVSACEDYLRFTLMATPVCADYHM